MLPSWVRRQTTTQSLRSQKESEPAPKESALKASFGRMSGLITKAKACGSAATLIKHCRILLSRLMVQGRHPQR